MVALRRYLRSPAKDPHLSLEEIFRNRPSPLLRMTDPVKRLVRKMQTLKTKSKKQPSM